MSPYTDTSKSTPITGTSQPTFLGILRERRASLSVIFVSGALAVPGTSSAEPKRLWESPYARVVEPTASSPGWHTPKVGHAAATDSTEETRSAISTLRRISGLTWEQLGDLFGVSRRSVHFWASGKPLNAANEERLLRVLGVVRKADRGDARLTRAALFNATDGTTPFDLLVAQRFDEAATILGEEDGRRTIPRTELSAAAKAARKPLPPEELVDAMHDRIHQERQGRAARTVKVRQRKRD